MKVLPRYGWQKQLPDFRDLKITAGRVKTLANLPPLVDLRTKMPPVYDQGDLGSCTANAIAGAIQYQLIIQKYKWPFIPSRLFIYYNERSIENSIDSDSGANLRDGIKSINKVGVCPEDQLKSKFNWAYDISQFATQPPTACYLDAQLHKAVRYESVPQTIDALCSVIAEGIPISCGISVYDSFEYDTTISSGQVPTPAVDENFLGGHAILLVGYDTINKVFLFRNSWGTEYGQKGYGFIPFGYIGSSDLAGDFWAIQLMAR